MAAIKQKVFFDTIRDASLTLHGGYHDSLLRHS
jgi:hypothetical protein